MAVGTGRTARLSRTGGSLPFARMRSTPDTVHDGVMPGITFSAEYGAGGSTVAPAVAERLGWSFVDRAITSAVAERLHLPEDAVESGGASRWQRFLGSLAAFAPAPGEGGAVLGEDAQIRDAMAAELRAAVASGGAVVLGRAGACALLREPDVLRVRLYGPRQARLAQAARIEGVDEGTAQRRIDQVDRARNAYVKRLYGRRADDPHLYHLQLDSTALSPEACIDVVLTAWDRFSSAPAGRG